MLRKRKKCAALLLVCCILFQTTYYCVIRPNVVYATWAGGVIGGGAVAGLGLTGPEVALAVAALFGIAYAVDNADTIYTEMNNCINKAVDGVQDGAAVVADWWDEACTGIIDTTSSVWKGVCNWFSGARDDYYGNTVRAIDCPAGTVYKILNNSYSCNSDTIAVPYFMIGQYGKYKDVHVGISFWSDARFKGSYGSGDFTSEYDSDSGLYYKLCDHALQTDDETAALKQLSNDNVAQYGDLSFCYEDPYVKAKLMSYLRTLVSVKFDGTAAAVLTGGIDKVLEEKLIDDAADVIWPDTIVLNPDLAADEELATILEKLRSGELTWTDCWDRVASGERVGVKTDAGTFTLDDAGVTDVPYEKDATDAPPADTDTPALNDSLADYKTDGLTSLFPFCIPFDLINCIKLMSATGEAPCWEFPFKVPMTDIEDTITIDLAKWDSVAAVCRSVETLLFIGLLISRTREFIRG